MKVIPYGCQNITEEDIAAVVEALRAEQITQGPKVAEFEKLIAGYIGVKHAVAVNSGTAALHLACLAMDLKKGDKIITTPITFAASANAARYCQADVEFVDIERKTRCLDLDLLEKKLSSAGVGAYKAVVIVDFAGYAADLERLRTLADKFKFLIVEDACHALGGGFSDSKGRFHKLGSCSLADMAALSFHPVKHITTGEGGMLLTNNDQFKERAILFRTHGITRDQNLMHENHGAWYYEMQDLGFNYRICDVQCALGISQFGRLEEGNRRRKEIAARYNLGLKNLPVTIQTVPNSIDHAYHLYVIETEKRDLLYKHLRNHSIFSQVHYIPVNAMPYYRDLGHNPEETPQALEYYGRCLSLPMYPTLTDEQQDFVMKTIKEFFETN